MATTQATKSVNGVAAADLSAKVGYFGKFVTQSYEANDPGIDVWSTAQGMPHGVIAENAAAGRPTSLILPGCIAKAVVGSVAIVAYTKVAAHSDGTMVAIGASNGNECCGFALEAAAVGAMCTFYFAPLGQINA